MTRRAAVAPGEAPGEFAGFGGGAQRFLRALERHNERAWFEANRATYEREVRAPLAALVEEVDVRLATMAPEIVGHPKRSLFRIHRDVRFSADKSPYKTHASAWFHHAAGARGVGGAPAPHGGAGFYFDVGPRSASIGGGIWMPPRPTLGRLREAIDEGHPALTRLLAAPALRRYGGLAEEAMLTRTPRGVEADHPAAGLLRHRSFTVGRPLTARELLSARLPDLLAREYTRILPLVRWINGALGLRPLARR